VLTHFCANQTSRQTVPRVWPARQRRQEPATGSIESNPPTLEPVTIPAQIGAALVGVEVPAAEAEAPGALPLVEVLADASAVEQVEVEDLASLPVVRLRKLAAAAGHRDTRIARKAELLALLSVSP
jgi:hypothetical protein